MDTVLNDLQIEEPGTAIVPPIDTEMADILPDSAANTGALGASKKEKKLSKEEKKAMKEQKKKAKKAENGDIVKVNGAKRTIDEVEDVAGGAVEKKKKREKHKHGKE